MTALQWIVKEAKKIKKEYPKRFSKWTEYVAQASAIYAKKHKGKSPVGKKKKSKVGYSKERLDVVFRATPLIKKYKKKGFSKRDALKNANLDAAFMGSTKKKTLKKSAKKSPARSLHKDTKSHNVNIRVMSGIKDSIDEIKTIHSKIAFNEGQLEANKNMLKNEKFNAKEKKQILQNIKLIKLRISDYKKHLRSLKKHI